jgi:competence protein ComEC
MADSVLLQNASSYTFNLQPHLWHLGIEQPYFAALADSVQSVAGAAYTVLPDSNGLLVWQGQRMLLLSHPAQLSSHKPLPLDYLLLRHNVRLKPQDLQHYKAGKVILDASNSPWYRQRLHQQLDTLGIAYYDVADSGAFVLRLR